MGPSLVTRQLSRLSNSVPIPHILGYARHDVAAGQHAADVRVRGCRHRRTPRTSAQLDEAFAVDQLHADLLREHHGFMRERTRGDDHHVVGQYIPMRAHTCEVVCVTYPSPNRGELAYGLTASTETSGKHYVDVYGTSTARGAGFTAAAERSNAGARACWSSGFAVVVRRARRPIRSVVLCRARATSG